MQQTYRSSKQFGREYPNPYPEKQKYESPVIDYSPSKRVKEDSDILKLLRKVLDTLNEHTEMLKDHTDMIEELTNIVLDNGN